MPSALTNVPKGVRLSLTAGTRQVWGQEIFKNFVEQRRKDDLFRSSFNDDYGSDTVSGRFLSYEHQHVTTCLWNRTRQPVVVVGLLGAVPMNVVLVGHSRTNEFFLVNRSFFSFNFVTSRLWTTWHYFSFDMHCLIPQSEEAWKGVVECAC